VDFYLGGNLFQAFAAQENNVPTVAIGAFFKKDPQCLMAHPSQNHSFKELKDRPIFISKIGLATFFPWLKAEFGFSESNVKPYLFNTQGFLADKTSLCQAYVTSEPFAIKQASGLEVQSFLLDDYGFKTPSNLIEVKREMPLVLRQKFMQASQKGWASYIKDGTAGNTLIKSLNPDITDAKISFAKNELIKHDFISEGLILRETIALFYNTMAKAGALKAGLNPLLVYDASL
jgi:NitT/TauT family transport system substrate-binding protein